MSTASIKQQQRHKAKKSKKSGGLSIKIKPFANPPSLPPNFYISSLDILLQSLDCILHRRPLLLDGTFLSNSRKHENDISASKLNTHVIGTNPAYNETSSPTTSTADPTSATFTSKRGKAVSMSREELYTKVQDLCTHSYGPQLYRQVIQVLDASAVTCLRRLCEQQQEPKQQRPSNSKLIFYPTRGCAFRAATDVKGRGGFVYFSSLPHGGAESSKLLENVWSMWSDYVEYLNCLRSVLLHLDRMYMYVPGVENEKDAIIPRSRLSGRVVNGNAGGGAGSAGGAWSLWEVGMHSLWKHMSLVTIVKNASVSSGDVASAGISAMEESGKIQSETMMVEGNKFSVLDALKSCTVSSLLAELNSSSTLDYQAVNLNVTSGDLLHKPLVRNCVSIFGTLGGSDIELEHGYIGPSNDNSNNALVDTSGGGVMEGFLQELVSAMVVYFSEESQKWMANGNNSNGGLNPSSNMSSSVPTKTGYDARSLLHHVDARLKQVHNMTLYYLLRTNSSHSNTPNTNSGSDGGTLHSTTSNRHLSNSSSSKQNRLLTQIVETYLLTPHFNPSYILHPASLYPLLDDEDGNGLSHIKRLFALSKRVVSSPPMSSTNQYLHNDVNISASMAAVGTGGNGLERLRTAFGEYGREKGLSIVRMRSFKGGASSGNLAHASPTKPAPVSTKDLQNQIVAKLLDFKLHLETLHQKAFGGDEGFGRSIRSVLEDVLNAGGGDEFGGDAVGRNDVVGTSGRRRNASAGNRGNLSASGDGGKRLAELLAKFMDSRFKNAKAGPTSNVGGWNTMSSSIIHSNSNDTESFQTAVLDIFRHVHSKDVFEAFYRRDLAKRLLNNKSTSIDAERSFVTKLKAECGGAYTSKMEGMFKDMDLSRDVMGSYDAYIKGNASIEIEDSKMLDMDVQVLTTGYWPVYPQHSLILPPMLEAHKKQFDSYYKTKYQGRRIAWQNSLGNCVVKAMFPKIKGVRELVVNLYQALALLCFNEEEQITVENSENIQKQRGQVGCTILDVMKQIGLDDRSEAERVLQSLSMGRDGTRVLTKIDYEEDDDKEEMNDKSVSSESKLPSKKKSKKMRRSVSDKDIFVFNADFTSNRHRILITNIQMKETSEERSKTHEAVSRDRLYLIDAAVVRIMKARKTLSHRGLVGEVMNQLKFPASGVDVKKRIESLIEREYIERAEGDRSTYNYLA